MTIGRIVFLAVLLPGAWALAGDPIRKDEAVVSEDLNRFSQRLSLGKKVVVVDVRARAFQKTKHKLKVNEQGVEKVDGRRVLGTDGGPAEEIKSEIASVEVSWNGTRFKMERPLFADCFNTTAVPARVLASDDFQAVMITMTGGDGAGAYRVTWIVSEEGAVRRFVAETGELTGDF